MTSKNQMLELAIALNGEIPKKEHRCSISPPCFCCKFDNYQKDFATCLKKKESKYVDFLEKKEPNFTREFLMKMRWYSNGFPGIYLSYQYGKIYDEILTVHQYYQEIWGTLNWFVLKAKLVKNQNTLQLNYLSESGSQFPNMLLLNICRFVNPELDALVEFHSNPKEDGFSELRSYLEFPMKGYRILEK